MSFKLVFGFLKNIFSRKNAAQEITTTLIDTVNAARNTVKPNSVITAAREVAETGVARGVQTATRQVARGNLTPEKLTESIQKAERNINQINTSTTQSVRTIELKMPTDNTAALNRQAEAAARARAEAAAKARAEAEAKAEAAAKAKAELEAKVKAREAEMKALAKEKDWAGTKLKLETEMKQIKAEAEALYREEKLSKIELIKGKANTGNPKVDACLEAEWNAPYVDAGNIRGNYEYYRYNPSKKVVEFFDIGEGNLRNYSTRSIDTGLLNKEFGFNVNSDIPNTYNTYDTITGNIISNTYLAGHRKTGYNPYIRHFDAVTGKQTEKWVFPFDV